MQSFAEYVMRGRLQSVLAISVFALLALTSPLLFVFAYLGGAIVALVVLRRGLLEAVGVVAGGTAVVALLNMLAGASPLLAAIYAVIFWLPVLGLAAVLNLRKGLGPVLMLAGLTAMLVLVGLHATLGDVSAWWVENMHRVNAELKLGLTAEVIARESRYLTGLAVGSVFVTGQFAAVLLARWWQSMLDNPGGFRAEFYALSLPRMVGPVALGLIGLGLLMGAGTAEGSGTLVLDLMVIVIMVYVFQGLAVAHSVVSARKLARGWLTAMYVLLVVTQPLSAKIVAGVGLTDAWMKFRSRLAMPREPK